MSLDDDFDWEAILGDSNGPAYQKTEERHGPPLEYVAEKARHSLEHLHEVLRLTEEHARGGLSRPEAPNGTAVSPMHGSLLTSTRAAFHYGLVAYLALENMLNLANDHNLVDRLLHMSTTEFRSWLEAVGAEGSVTG